MTILRSGLSAVCFVSLIACGAAPVSRQPAESAAAAPHFAAVSTAVQSTHDWIQFGWDAARSSSSLDPTGISAQNVGSLTRQQVQLDGTVDASAIYLHRVGAKGGNHDVFFVTTTYGRTLAIDAGNGAILWRFTPAAYDSWAGSRRITTSTPVADPNRQFIYAASPDGHIQKLAVSDGHAIWSTAITRLPDREKIASPLSYFHGKIIAVTGGYIGDAPPYQGHVAVLDAGSGRLLHVWNSLCSDEHALIDPASCAESGSAIWGRAGAVIDSTTGDIFVATGNAKWDGRTNWGDAVIELDSSATNILDNYSPTNTNALSDRDADVGSTSPVLLGGGYVAQGGKDASIRVLQFGRTRGAAPRLGGESQTIPAPAHNGLYSAQAVWRTGGKTWMFAATGSGTTAWTFDAGRLTEKWSNNKGGTSPVVAGGLLYVYDLDGGLRVYSPESGQQVAELQCGNGHWNSPIVVDGMIALPEGNANRHQTSGVLDIWRVP